MPSDDQAVILDLIDKTIAAATAPAQVAIVFDSISDMILSAGFEATYKFVKQVNEATGNGRTAALFLMTLGAHDEKVGELHQEPLPYAAHRRRDRAEADPLTVRTESIRSEL